MMHVKQISDNEIYLLIKYIKSVVWRVAKRLSYIEEARCLKVKRKLTCVPHTFLMPVSKKSKLRQQIRVLGSPQPAVTSHSRFVCISCIQRILFI